MTFDTCDNNTAVGYSKSNRSTSIFDKPYGKVLIELEGGSKISIKRIELIREVALAYWVETENGWIPLQDIILD